MDQDRRHQNYGQQFGFDHYDLPPGRKSTIEKIFGQDFANKLRSPIFAAAALLLTGAAFAGIIIASYPVEQQSGEIPTVKADTFAYKEAPSEASGMNIPNRDTTIFQTMAESQSTESPPIENLLADEQPIDKLAAFQRQVEQIETEEAAAAAADNAPAESSSDQPSTDSVASAMVAKPVTPSAEPAQEQLASAVPPEIKPQIADIPDPVPPSAAIKRVSPQPPAGSNPETLEYVRQVLDRKDRKDGIAAAEQLSKVEPASGLAAKPGSYYIQLGSITSESGAASEWNKFKRDYATQLEGLQYRVQRADLDKGTFYRIQAGPVSEESAKTLCNSIKAQKPGGCFVTQ